MPRYHVRILQILFLDSAKNLEIYSSSILSVMDNIWRLHVSTEERILLFIGAKTGIKEQNVIIKMYKSRKFMTNNQ